MLNLNVAITKLVTCFMSGKEIQNITFMDPNTSAIPHSPQNALTPQGMMCLNREEEVTRDPFLLVILFLRSWQSVLGATSGRRSVVASSRRG